MERPDVVSVVDRVIPRRPGVIEADKASLEELFYRLGGFYTGWRPPARREGEIRVHPLTRTWRGFCWVPAAAALYSDAHLAGYLDAGDAYAVRCLRSVYSACFLYADSVVDLDPLSFSYLAARQSGIPSIPVEGLPVALHFHELLAPLVEAGLLILAPIGPLEAENEDYPLAKHLMKAADPGRPEDHPDVIVLANLISGSRVAKQTNASVLPTFARGWHHLEALGIGSNQPGERLDLTVASGLACLDLPILAGVPAEVLTRIHAEEDAFVEWRAQLRATARAIESALGRRSFEQTARRAFEDLLVPQTAAVRRAVSRSRALRDAAREGAVRTVLGGMFVGGVDLTFHLPLPAAVASAGANFIANIIAAGLHVGRPMGAGAIIAELLGKKD